MAGKCYTLVLNFGYVEHSGLSYTPFTSRVRFKDAKDALQDLAAFLKERYLEKEDKPKKCCTATKEKDPEAEFCSRCRCCLDFDFDLEDFQEWISRVDGCDIDSFHGDLIDWNDEDRWQCDGLEGAPNPRYVYQAEQVLAAALDEKRTKIEEIFRRRSKDHKTSFSYW